MVHRFERRPVPPELVAEVLETALHAPSAGFSQGFAMVVLDGPDQVSWFHRTTAGGEEVARSGPPVLVLALVSPGVYLERYNRPDKAPAGLTRAERWPVPYWWVDAGMASMLVLLAAVDRGLGGWFFGIAKGKEEVLRALGVPEGWELVGVIGLGYKSGDDRPVGSPTVIPRRRLDEVVRRGRW
jgi:nitroreductase